MLNELDCVRLNVDLPEEGLERDAIGAIVYVHQGGAAFEVEFVEPSGRTVAVVRLRPEQVRALEDDPRRTAGEMAESGEILDAATVTRPASVGTPAAP